MTNIVALLREAAAFYQDSAGYDANTEDCQFPEYAQTSSAFTAAADELEASAEYALCKWLAEDQRREANVEFDDFREDPWQATIGIESERFVRSERTIGRADAIRAAIKAWEDR